MFAVQPDRVSDSRGCGRVWLGLRAVGYFVGRERACRAEAWEVELLVGEVPSGFPDGSTGVRSVPAGMFSPDDEGAVLVGLPQT